MKEQGKLEHSSLLAIHEVALPYFNKLWDKGTENERYLRVDPFTDSQKSEYAAQDRLPFHLGLINKKIYTIKATEDSNRTSWKVNAKNDPNDEIKAELATLRLKDIESQNNLKYTGSDIFLSGIGVIYGAAEIAVEQSKAGEQVVRVNEVDYKNLCWDSNAVEYDKSDAVWMAKIHKAYRVDLKREYPEKKLRPLPIGQVGLWGREKTEYFLSTNRDGQSDLDLISVFTHYHKVIRDYYTVLFNGEVVSTERKKKDAEKTLRMLQIPYLSQGQDVPPSDVIHTPKIMLDKYVFTYTDILEYEETDLEFFPFAIYQAFHFKDAIWSMTDVLKSLQQFVDRLLAQIDYAFGTDIKNGWEIVVPWLADGVSIEDAIQKIKDGEPIPVNRPNSINSVKSKGANPQWIEMMGILTNYIDEIAGGKTFGGTANSSGQSGKAIKALVGQGELLASMFIDNLQRWKKGLGEKVLWFLQKYDTEPYVMKVQGGSLTPEMIQLLQQHQIYAPSMKDQGVGYMKMNQGSPLSYLKDADFELTVSEEELSESRKETEFNKMLLLEQSDPTYTMSPTWKKLKLEKGLNLSYEDRQKIEQEVAQAQAAQQQAQQNIQQQQLDVQKAKVLASDRATDVKADLVDKKENKKS